MIRVRGVAYRDADDALEAQRSEEVMSDIDPLFLSILAPMRPEDPASIFDLADDQERAQAEITHQREEELCDALDACVRAGVAKMHLRTLARETGACTWAMKNSLKGE